ncbi:unnamed protein product [Zymoseptoria tritici ST99CH_3D1]|nr:unnamed protein product [Zymoseptoria tritici ST99CH_3D1]
MPTTEQIIFEAKQRPIPHSTPRRPSTIISDRGCVITHGFIIPSRSSSKSSLESMARSSSTSSINPSEIPGTPASPISIAPPGYQQPTGSLYHAPEMQILKRMSTSSMLPPTAPTGSLSRPPMPPRRQTEPPPQKTGRWATSDLEQTTCKVVSGIAQLHLQSRIPLPCPQPVRTDSKNAIIIVAACDAENAIESDSEEEEEEEFTHPKQCGIAAMRAKPTYFQRRALQAQSLLARRSSSCAGDSATISAGMTIKAAPARENDPPVLRSFEECETPREVRSFSRGDRVPHRALRPSASRPSPVKGVLKRRDSPRSSGESERSGEGGGGKRVSTSVRMESGIAVRVEA